MTQTPWRERPDSTMRAFVAGNVVGGWGTGVLSVLVALIVDMPALLLLGLIYLFIGAFATYMWRHG